MLSIIGKLPGPDIELIQAVIEPVYRYHFARCENYLEAQNLTLLTLSAALKWIAVDRSRQGNLCAWVLGIAYDLQSLGVRQRNLAVKHVTGAASISSSDPESLPPEQAEILLRNRMAHLSSSWRRLPGKQADALALHFFGGLSLPEVGLVLHKPEAAIKALMAHETAFEAELLELAANIHPGRDLFPRLVQALSQPNVSSSPWRPASSAWRRFMHIGARLGQAALLAGVLAAGFMIIQHPSTPARNPTATQASTGAIAALGTTPTLQTPPGLDYPGNLIPPSASICQEWQTALTGAIDQKDVTLSSVAFSDPTQFSLTQPGIDAKGIGCSLETTVIHWDLHGAWATFDSISRLLYDQNYKQIGDAGLYPGYGDKNYFDPGCYGLGRFFASRDTRAILTVSWCAPDQAAAGTGIPNPLGSVAAITPDLGSSSPQSISIRPYSLKLVLASNTLNSSLNSFFSQWSAGDLSLTPLLAPSLLKRFPNLEALDRLAGINRDFNPEVNFSWKIIDNSGAHLRVMVQVSRSAGQEAPPTPLAEFQMAITLDNNTWTIHDLGNTVQFSS